MGALEALRRRFQAARARRGRTAAGRRQVSSPSASASDGDHRRPGTAAPSLVEVDDADEGVLWGTLHDDPNDVTAFHRLAEVVRRRAGEGHEGGDQQRAMDDAVWSLAEELAHSGRAWYPLIELARLSVHDDREAALRRLGTAADRDPHGLALASGLAMLRDQRLPGDAANLGVGHWRPREHVVEAGRQLVEACIESGRFSDARRHLEALNAHQDADAVAEVRREVLPWLDRATAAVPPGTPASGLVIVDLRGLREPAVPRNPFRRR